MYCTCFQFSAQKSRGVGRAMLACKQGSILVKTAFILPALVVLVGGTIEYSVALRDRAALQSAADAAALGASKELSLTNTKTENLTAVAKVIVDSHFNARASVASGPTVLVSTKVSGDPIEVQVAATKAMRSMFGEVLGLGNIEISVQAVARVIGRPNICVLGLNPDEGRTISLEKQARVTGRNCAVYSNSSHTGGLKAKNSAVLSAALICSRGGKDGGPGNFTPDPLVDCPEFDDPLADRPEPFIGVCNPNQPAVIESDMTLVPGTYCGLNIRKGAVVRLLDGVYVIKDAPLIVTDGASLLGESVGLFFIGKNANFTFGAQSTISLEAPTSGPMAGLLVFASRSQSDSLTYSILSNNARTLIGTIYVPRGELRIDAESPIADQSAYTAIVADKMRLYGGPHLVLNTNYDATDVPVPEGIRGVGQPAILVQ